MGYYWDVICYFSIYVTLIMSPTQEFVGVMAMIKYHLVIVGKTVLAYPTDRSIFPFMVCYTGENVLFPFFYVKLSR